MPKGVVNEFDIWAAGFWEGEGWLSKASGKNKNSFFVGINQALVDDRDIESIMNKLKNTYGGNVYFYKKDKYNPNAKDQLTWRLSKGSDVINFIKRIYPYCYFRKKQLEKVLNIYKQHPEYFTQFTVFNIKKAEELKNKGFSIYKISKILKASNSVVWRRLTNKNKTQVMEYA